MGLPPKEQVLLTSICITNMDITFSYHRYISLFLMHNIFYIFIKSYLLLQTNRWQSPGTTLALYFPTFLHSPFRASTWMKLSVLCDDFLSLHLKIYSLLIYNTSILAFMKISWHILWFSLIASLIYININMLGNIHITSLYMYMILQDIFLYTLITLPADHHLLWHLYLSAFQEQQHIHHQYKEGEMQDFPTYNWKLIGMDYTVYILV